MIRGYLGLRGTGTEGGMTIMKDEADRQRDRQGQGFLECGGGVRLFSSSSFFSLVRCASFADTRAPERGGRVGRVLKKWIIEKDKDQLLSRASQAGLY